jgi:hypothetical protein
MGHCNTATLRQMVCDGMIKVKLLDDKEFQCDPCLKGKATRGITPKVSSRTTGAVGELIHSDVWGPAQNSFHRRLAILCHFHRRFFTLFCCQLSQN